MKTNQLNFYLIFGYIVSLSISSTAGPLNDPCLTATCGKGAVCHLKSNLVSCNCPEHFQGDPFVSCNPITSPAEPTSNPETSTTTSMTNLDRDVKMSPAFNLSPTHGEEQTEMDDAPSYFPSAPPTLSHYAQIPPFFQVPSDPEQLTIPPNANQQPPGTVTEPMASSSQQMNHAYSNPRLRSRPQQSFQGTINHGFQSENNEASSSNGNYQHPNPNPHLHLSVHPTSINNGVGFETSQNHRLENRFDRNPDQLHLQRPTTATLSSVTMNNNQALQLQPNNGFPINNHNDLPIPLNRMTTPHLQNSYIHFQSPENQHHHSHFNLKQESGIPQRQDLAKDPLGIYSDCRTLDNRIVCADLSSPQDLLLESPHHRVNTAQVHAGNQGFEHRHISIANDNTNALHNPPPRVDTVSNAGKIKSGQSHTPGEGHQHFHPIHHVGPPGTINLFPVPVVSSTEVHQTDSVKTISGTQASLHNFQETKPFTPQAGTDEAKMCQTLCGEGSVCRVFHNRPICGCPEGHTGDPAKKCFPDPNTKFDPNSCQRHTDCAVSMICQNSQCTDPCLIKSTFDTSKISSFHHSLDTAVNKNENMCGPNAKCSVVEHTPLCSCDKNTYGNPYVGCVP